jgi:hypothetical protein
MVFICAMAIIFIYQPERRDYRMLQGLFKDGMRRDVCIPET